jgi:exopolysaccharide biosynthesis operon protein EpsL
LRANPSRLALAVAAALLSPMTVLADAQDPYNLVAGASVRYEDNLFRLENATQAKQEVGNSQRSDWIYSEYAGIKIDKPYAMQRFQLDFTAFHNHNQTYHFLDFNGINYRGAWLWQLTPRISGELSASQNQTITPYSDFRGTNTNLVLNRRSVQTNESRVFNFDGDIGMGIHLVGAATENRSRNSQNSTAVADYVQDAGELGVKYVSTANNSITLVRREATGDYRGRQLDAAGQFDTGFKQHETEARLYWALTGKSEVLGRMDYLEREHDHFSSRDFSGMTGNLTYRWTPTGETRIDLSVYRSLNSFQEAVDSYYVTEGIAIMPVWVYSAKTSFRLRYDYSDRDYRGAVIPLPAGFKMREDRVQSLLVEADWKATRTILVSGTLQHEERDSNISGLDYKANVVSVNAQLLF